MIQHVPLPRSSDRRSARAAANARRTRRPKPSRAGLHENRLSTESSIKHLSLSVSSRRVAKLDSATDRHLSNPWAQRLRIPPSGGGGGGIVGFVLAFGMFVWRPAGIDARQSKTAPSPEAHFVWHFREVSKTPFGAIPNAPSGTGCSLSQPVFSGLRFHRAILPCGSKGSVQGLSGWAGPMVRAAALVRSKSFRWSGYFWLKSLTS